MNDFAALIERLSQVETAPDAYNQYGAGDNPYNALRRANLLRYFQDVYARQTPIVLIAEAPGYRGMRSRKSKARCSLAKAHGPGPSPSWTSMTTLT